MTDWSVVIFFPVAKYSGIRTHCEIEVTDELGYGRESREEMITWIMHSSKSFKDTCQKCVHEWSTSFPFIIVL